MKMSLFIGVMRCMRKDIQKFANQALKNLEMDPKDHVFMKRMNTPFEKEFYRDVLPLAKSLELEESLFLESSQEQQEQKDEETQKEETGSNSPSR